MTKNNISFTQQALEQIVLIIKNDFTVEGKVLRLTISGKECDGFNYDFGFDDNHPDDIVEEFNYKDTSFKLARDPFTAHYFQNGKIDYKLDLQNNIDGFVVTNFNQDSFQGKFFKDESLTPSHLKDKIKS